MPGGVFGGFPMAYYAAALAGKDPAGKERQSCKNGHDEVGWTAPKGTPCWVCDEVPDE